jgi:hypothetical protein
MPQIIYRLCIIFKINFSFLMGKSKIDLAGKYGSIKNF